MSPILRREDQYDPRKRRAAWWAQLRDADRQADGAGEEPLMSPDAVRRHRSYGSEHDSVSSQDTEPERGKLMLDAAEECRLTQSPSPELDPPPLPHPGTPYLKRTIVHLALSLALQSTPALLLSLTGLVFTGQLLDHLAVWSVFRRVDELFILVPVLGNLKGNLEMCLGARLGTSANRGHLDTSSRRRSIVSHALTYLLLQALTISSIAGVLSFLLGLALNHRIASTDPTSPPPPTEVGVDGPHREGYTPPGAKEFILVVGTGMAAACISSLVLGNFMAWLVVACRWLGLDPDNIACPLAATLGDLLTLFIMALVGTALVKTINTPVPGVLVLVLCAATGGIWWSLRAMARRRRHVRIQTEEEGDEGGWSPLVGAMLISSATGLVLDRSVNRYKGFALLAISITGIAGSIGAIHASRLSTALHAARRVRVRQSESETRASSPLLGLADGHIAHHIPPPLPPHQQTETIVTLTDLQSAITLFLISWPIQAVFVAFVWLSGWIELGGSLTLCVGLTYGITVAFSIYMAQVMTLFFWSKDLDPDLIDLLGQIILVLAFEIAARMGADVINVDGG